MLALALLTRVSAPPRMEVVMTTSALLFHGVSYLSTIEHELSEWMHDHGYRNLHEMRGAAVEADTGLYLPAIAVVNL